MLSNSSFKYGILLFSLELFKTDSAICCVFPAKFISSPSKAILYFSSKTLTLPSATAFVICASVASLPKSASSFYI
jgi:hypothetical protein